MLVMLSALVFGQEFGPESIVKSGDIAVHVLRAAVLVACHTLQLPKYNLIGLELSPIIGGMNSDLSLILMTPLALLELPKLPGLPVIDSRISISLQLAKIRPGLFGSITAPAPSPQVTSF